MGDDESETQSQQTIPDNCIALKLIPGEQHDDAARLFQNLLLVTQRWCITGNSPFIPFQDMTRRPPYNSTIVHRDKMVWKVLEVMNWIREQADLSTVVEMLFDGLGSKILGRWMQLHLPNDCSVFENEHQVYLDFKVRKGEVALLTGAGATKALTNNQAEDWIQLLKRVRNDLNFEKPYDAFIDKHPHAAAQKVIDLLSTKKKDDVKLEQSLKQFTFGATDKVNTSCPFAEVVRGFQGPILTFNYDEALEKVCWRTNRKPSDEDEASIRSNSVIHLHGVSRGDSFLLSQESYIEHATETSRFLKKISDEGYMLLFVGVGGALLDPDLEPFYQYERSKRLAADEQVPRPIHISIGSVHDRENCTHTDHYNTLCEVHRKVSLKDKRMDLAW